jgi:hypothetical protein
MDGMKRKFETATCRINEDWQEVPAEMRDKVMFVTDVKSTIKRARHATGLMDLVIAEASRKGRGVVVEPRSFDDGMTDKELQGWYARLGFTVFQTKTEDLPCLMLKNP